MDPINTKYSKEINTSVIFFRNYFIKSQNKYRAEKEKAYLKSTDIFYGVSVPQINNITKEFRKSNPTLEKDKLFKIVNQLWESGYHEEKTLALKLLQIYNSYLSFKDMILIEDMLQHSKGWAHIDEISCHLVSCILFKNKKAFKYLINWSNSENFWMRRSSLISQISLFRTGAGDKELFFQLAEKMLTEKEFFIRKAIGWTLRELSKTDPQSVVMFVKKNRNKISNLSFKEGTRRLPQNIKKELNGFNHS